MSKSSQSGSDAALSVKDALTLIATIRPAALIAALKHPDFAMIVGIAFAGFRFDGNGLANPLVRRRLSEEASRNSHFTEKLRELAELAQAVPPRQPPGAAARPVVRPSEPLAAPQPDRSAEKYRDERDRLKRELSDEADRRRAAERDIGQAKLDSLAASTAKLEADREAARQKQRAERLERKLRRLELENAQLRRVAGTSLAPVEREQSLESSPQQSDNSQTDTAPDAFVDAVNRLLDKQKWPVARAIAEDVLRFAPSNADALSIHAAACEGLGDMRSALQDRRALLALEIGRGDLAAAALSLGKLISTSIGNSNESKAVRDFYVALNSVGINDTAIRQQFDSIKVASPAAYEALREAAQGNAASTLFTMQPVGRVSADEALPIALGAGLPRSVTGRLAASWIDRNETAIVTGLRVAVAAAGDAALTRLAAVLEAATDGDASYYRLLSRRTLAGPAVVDASNVAWAGQEMIASPKPRLRQVVALRHALREMGYFPILLIADANFPFVVDDNSAARKMVADGHVALATGGTDADVLILQEAKRLNAPIVSNDYMAEWDPGQEVTKLQYTIAPTSGVVTIYR